MRSEAFPGMDTTREGTRVVLAEEPVRRIKVMTLSDMRGFIVLGIYRAAAQRMNPDRLAAIASYVPLRRLRTQARDMRRGLAMFHPKGQQFDGVAIAKAFRRAFSRRALIYAAERDCNLPDVVFAMSGDKNVRAALENGHGAILWMADFLFQTHMGKRGLQHAGFHVHHLTSDAHGHSTSRFGRRWFNPWQKAIEARFLKGWIRHEPHSAPPVKPRIEAVLRSNGVVSIVNNAAHGRRFIELALGANSVHRMAAGPIDLALGADTPLLPCAVIEEVPLRRYRIVIGADLRPEPLRGGVAITDEMRLTVAVNYGRWLEPLVAAHPEQWLGWRGLQPRVPL